MPDAEKDALTEVERSALANVLCDLTYRGQRLTPAHARALVKYIEPVVLAIGETRVTAPSSSRCARCGLPKFPRHDGSHLYDKDCTPHGFVPTGATPPGGSDA